MMPVEVDMVTPQGMRQRYLKGRHNRARYTEKYQLLSPELVPGQVYVQSSNYLRTMQSAYSELMGFYPPGDSGVSQLPEALVTDLGVARPPFHVRDEI